MNVLSHPVRVAVGICAALLATPVVAQASDQPPALTIHTTDLDLATPTGVTALHRRVLRAADHVCGVQDAWEAHAMSLASRCRAIARHNAEPQVAIAINRAGGAPMLAANDVKASTAGL